MLKNKKQHDEEELQGQPIEEIQQKRFDIDPAEVDGSTETASKTGGIVKRLGLGEDYA